MLTEHLLDAREMEPPEPFEKACDILAQLNPGEYLKMIHRRVPYPLFDTCNQLSLQHAVKEIAAQQYQVIIFFECDRIALQQEQLL